MGTNIVSHDTELMRNWSNTMEDNSDDYDRLINRLYALVEEFAGSSDFRGGLSSDFLDKVLSQKNTFQRYSTTFRECSKLISDTSRKIDSDDAELKSIIGRANPLD